MHIYKKKLHYLKTKNVSTETRALVIAEADVLCKKSEAKLGTLAEKNSMVRDISYSYFCIKYER